MPRAALPLAPAARLALAVLLAPALLAPALFAGCRPRTSPEPARDSPSLPPAAPSPPLGAALDLPPGAPTPLPPGPLALVPPGATSPLPGGPARLPAAGRGASEHPSMDTDSILVEEGHNYPVKIWYFALSEYRVQIEDVGMTRALDQVLARTGAELAINGGFFDHEGRPMGLAVSGGAVLSEPSRELGGGIVAIEQGRARLLDGEIPVPPGRPELAIQCRPRLVVAGKANVRRDDGKRAERTALCLREKGQAIEVILVRSEPGGPAGPSLFALGQSLERRGCEGALNLDGGPSTGAAWREDGQARSLPPRGPVRHALTFTRREEKR